MSKLLDIRRGLNLTQEGLARLSNLPLPTYRNAEKGKNVSYTTGKAIFDAVNRLKADKGEEPLSHVEDLELSLV